MRLVLGCAIVLLATACAREARSQEPLARPILIAAASDLKFALEDVLVACGRADGVRVTYGSSGQLCAQIENGAPFDLFLSADMRYPRRLVASGAARPQSLFAYALGRIVVWVPAASALDIGTRGIGALVDPGVRRIAIANPAHAPYGQAAVAALRSLRVYDQVADRLVLGENVAQAAQFVESGAADAGIIALSLALAPPLRAKGRYWEVPADAFPRLEQGGVILKAAGDAAQTQALCDLLRSPRGRAILQRYGFISPDGRVP
jgi:molybdate transport system substrate-binding protein